MATNGGCRDIDELIQQRVPVYSCRIARGIRPGRLEWHAENVPIACGGVRVFPGDGVTVVPISHAEAVAQVARSDKWSPREKHEEATLDPDSTLELTDAWRRRWEGVRRRSDGRHLG